MQLAEIYFPNGTTDGLEQYWNAAILSYPKVFLAKIINIIEQTIFRFFWKAMLFSKWNTKFNILVIFLVLSLETTLFANFYLSKTTHGRE